ncbi:MAG: Na+/H+ antiporter NhaA [Gammaproteobacteria bacterium]|nr:Na+/H+ antiporter NhaA [Gammaproteobacteria bacterium]
MTHTEPFDTMRNNNDSLSSPLQKGFDYLTYPFREFIRDQKTSNALLVLATFMAIFIANSPWSDIYHTVSNNVSGFYLNGWTFEMTNQLWVNDGLMTLFFYVIGLEIKRELLAGELKSFRFTLPILAAAIGGMLLPALIYYGINAGTIAEHGWGIPMATDTAFAVGVLALLGKRIPIVVTTFLTALAIFDDLGAVVVIAVFYVDHLHMDYLYQAAAIFTIMMAMNRIGVRHPLPYLVGGILLWFAIHASGVHSTIAGILGAMTVPAKPKHEAEWFIEKVRHLVKKFEYLEKESQDDQHILSKDNEHEVIEDIERVAETATTPLQRWEHAVRRPIALFILPVFALTNAGIPVNFDMLPSTINSSEFWGIFLGLVVGKTLGITSFTWLALRLGLGELPRCVTMRHVIGIGLLGGMGFTMSIFIAGIGFIDHLDALINTKTAILTASMFAGFSGFLWLWYVSYSEQKNAELNNINNCLDDKKTHT